VEKLLRLENNPCRLEEAFLADAILQHVQHWAPTLLLAPTEGNYNARAVTMDMLKQLLFGPLDESEREDTRLHLALVSLTQDLATSCSNFVRNTFFNARNRDVPTLRPGQVNHMIEVVEHCLRYFEMENVIQEQRVEEIQAVMSALRAKSDSAIETLSSVEWAENSSELAELSNDEYDDPSGSP